MNIKLLDKEEVTEIYHQYMKADFPADELKPLAMIHKAMDDNRYECLALMAGEELCGYAFFVKIGKDYLFDYLATLKEKRNAGLGSIFLKLIGEFYRDADSIIGEVEDFHKEQDPDAAKLQERRYHFYLRNGYMDTGVRTCTFGVDFIVLEVPTRNSPLAPERIRELYAKIYSAILPKSMYEKNIVIF